MITVVRLPSFGIRPPGAPRSIRPPRNPGSTGLRPPTGPVGHVPANPATPPPDRTRPTGPPGPRGHHGPRTAPWATALRRTIGVILVITLATVAVRAVLHLTTPEDTTGTTTQGRTADPQDIWRSGRTPTPGTTTMDPSWTEAWRLDPGLTAQAADAGWEVIVSPSYLVLSDPVTAVTDRMFGYRLTDGAPELLWSVDATGIYVRGMSDAVIVSANHLLDPATGAVVDAPWDSQESPVWLMDDLIVTRNTETGTYSAWDWNGGAPTLRWSRVMPELSIEPVYRDRTVGDADSGYLMVERRDADSSSDLPVFLSLADGSLHDITAPTADWCSDGRYIAAADGWLCLTSDLTAWEMAPDGTPTTVSYTIGPTSVIVAVPESGRPTLAQYRLALEQGDTSWARVALVKKPYEDVTINGAPLEVPESLRDTHHLYTFNLAYSSWTLSEDGRYLILPSSLSRLGKLVVIDTVEATAVDLGPSITGDSARAYPHGNVILLKEGTAVVGYRPVE